MEVIGIICEYNPFHNGHKYHIDKIKKMYPNSLIVLALNGYFLERGEVSILSKEDKVKIALENGVDIVLELPFVYGTQSADIFAESSCFILNKMGCTKLVFGSECNDINILTKVAKKQLTESFKEEFKNFIKDGVNYPTALNKAGQISIDSPNDLLGISYIKAIMKNNYKMGPVTIQRTNSYHDIVSDEKIVSASNIREKLKNNLNVDKYTNYAHNFIKINDDLLFNLIKVKIITNHDLSKYLTVDEGLEYKIIKEIKNACSLDDLISKIKSKRYTYNRIRRMLIHILIGLLKEDKVKLELPEYIKILGFNSKGQKYLKYIKSDIPIQRKISDKYLAQKYELKAAAIYDLLTGSKALDFELGNKPIKID